MGRLYTEAELTQAQAERAARRVRCRMASAEDIVAGRAVSCGNCVNTTMHGDPRRGWCLAQRCMVSLAFMKVCQDYERP